jgi:hypothetical protein
MFPKSKILNLGIQQAALKARFPESFVRITRNELVWRGKLTPTPLSMTYTVQIEYRLTKNPSVTVLEPQLKSCNGERPPHLYRKTRHYPTDRLCLFLPGGHEWTGRLLLADTMVPWAAEWLLHYEIWLATGEWCGGGVHPGPSKKTPNL